MRVVVTEDCAGTGQCVTVAPAVFDFDADGLSRVLIENPTGQELEDARRAAALCPMAAIRIEE